MPNQVANGFVGREHLFSERLQDVSVQVVMSAIQESVDEHNRQADALMEEFVQPTTAYSKRFKQRAARTLQPLDEYGRPQPTQPAGFYDIAFPLQGGGDAFGFNHISKELVTVEEVNRHLLEALGADADWMKRHILAALLVTFPDAKTVNGFQRPLMIVGATQLLNCKHDRKIDTIVDVTRFFVSEQLKTVPELRAWLLNPANVQRLKQIKGVGNKTADYFKILVGLPAVAVDRHLFGFLAEAGISVADYHEAQRVIEETAVLLNVDGRTLDYSIWKYMAG